MKVKSLWLVLLPALAVGAAAQESRQDISLSGSGLLSTSVSGNPSISSKSAFGGLASYRYMLTPRSGLELNYQYGQTNFNYGGFYPSSVYVHARFQELSGAYVYNRNYGNFNPFLEGGIAGFVFSPIKGDGTSVIDVAQNTNVGVFYGAGLAYQISPSFDIRAEYRGLIVKEPSFSVPGLRTGVYQNLNNPVLGIAYHF
jgi:opacity protein-like surface antigen